MTQEKKPEESMTRRSYLQTVGGAVAGLVVGGAIGYMAKPAEIQTVTSTVTQTVTGTAPPPVTTVAPPTTVAPAVGEISWLCQDDPYNFAVPPLMESFKKASGITVKKETVGYGPLHDKTILDFTSHTGTYDVYAVVYAWTGEYYPYLLPLDDYWQKLKGTMNDMGQEATGDILPVMVKGGYSSGGADGGALKMVAVPLQPHAPLWIYRKDLAEREGIKFKGDDGGCTAEDVKAFAEAVNDPKNNFYGYVHNLKPPYAIGETYMHLLVGWGGRMFTRDFHADLNSEQAKKAIQWLVSMKPYMPPNFSDVDWDPMLAMLQQNTVAQAEAWYGRVLWLEDPTKSKTVGKCDAACNVHAKANTDWQQACNGWWIGINKDTKHPDQAWEWLKYIVTHDKEFVTNGNPPRAKSVFTDPVMSKKPFDRYEWRTGLIAWERGLDWARPPIPECAWVQEKLGETVSSILVGTLDIDKGLDELNDAFQKRLDDAGYYSKGINPLPPWYWEHYTPA